MASYQYLVQQTKPRVESPAKIFAKLKSRVQREEALCSGEGGFTNKDPLGSVGEKHEAEFRSHRKRSQSTGIGDELKENQRFGSYHNEVHAMTLSPISSPQKTLSYSYSNTIRKPAEGIPPVSEMRYECTPRKRAFLESTAVSQPPLVSRKQTHTEPPHIGDFDDFVVISRTPLKIQTVENDSLFVEECMFSPVMTRQRKRKLEPWGCNNVSSSTREVNSEFTSQPRGRLRPPSVDDTQYNTCTEDLSRLRGFSADQPELNQFTCEPVFKPPRSITKRRGHVFTDKVPPMSPAKMFAYMKERERKTEQQEVNNISSSTRNLFGGDEGNVHQSRDLPHSTVHSLSRMEDFAFRGVPDSAVDRSRVESADSESDTDPSEDVPTSATPSQPCLFEDPLVLNTPRISIPKNNECALKHKKWPRRTHFPNESVIYLKKWFLRRNHQGLFVDGIHREENIPWNSNIVMERVSNCVLKTVSGRVYILVGKMNLNGDSGFPKWFTKKFLTGFPSNWKTLYEKFLSESRDTETRKTSTAKTASGASTVNPSVKRHRQKPLKTPSSYPPDPSSFAQVSRSGRVIKPPLEYWKGGRVLLDAQMNVTIHECYNASLCDPDVSRQESSQKPAHLIRPRTEGKDNRRAASIEEEPVLLRKVKAPLRKRDRCKAKPVEKPFSSPEPSMETLSSAGKWSGGRSRSSQRHLAEARTLHVNTDQQEKPSTQRTNKQTPDSVSPLVRVSRRRQAALSSPESPAVTDQTSQNQSSSDFYINKKKKQVNRKKRAEKSPPSPTESEVSERVERKTREKKKRDAAKTGTKQERSKLSKTSQPDKPLPKSTQSSKKHKADKGITQVSQAQDEDEWTEEELMKLQEAVAFYPKHVAGYWAKVARIVGTRSAQECHSQHTSQGTSQSPVKTSKKPRKKTVEATKEPVSDQPVISARAGTFKRKQQVRQFLENMPRENVDDVFSSSYMRSKRFEIPYMCPSDDHDFALSDLEPTTPTSTSFPEVKTPQCLHITPGMMGSPNRSNDDKYVFQLQKRMRKRQFNVCKQAPSAKNFTPTPSVKRTMKKCGNTENNTFVVWEMFPGNDGGQSDSDEEQDFYFSDNE